MYIFMFYQLRIGAEFLFTSVALVILPNSLLVHSFYVKFQVAQSVEFQGAVIARELPFIFVHLDMIQQGPFLVTPECSSTYVTR